MFLAKWAQRVTSKNERDEAGLGGRGMKKVSKSGQGNSFPQPPNSLKAIQLHVHSNSARVGQDSTIIQQCCAGQEVEQRKEVAAAAQVCH